MVLNKKHGSFTISLDFELYWGVRDKRTTDAYRQNLLGVWEVIPKMLVLFDKYDIHVSWATVGFLFLENEKELRDNFPDNLPEYKEKRLSPYSYVNSLEDSDSRVDDFNKMHFAKKLIEEIKTYPFQEIATHTYSHYYTREATISNVAFESDMKKAIEVGSKNHIRLESLVFPRNQIDNKSLEILKNLGIKTFRGNPEHWAYKEGEVEKTFLQRVFRFVDIYINLSGAHLTIPQDIKKVKELKSSIFFRTFNKKFSFLEWLKLRRIKNAMCQAAKEGKNFHLWWHPHNFGVNQDENMANLEEVLKHFKILENKYQMHSLNMQELGSFYD